MYQRVSTHNPLNHNGGSPQRFVRELELGDGITDIPLQELHMEEAISGVSRQQYHTSGVRQFVHGLKGKYTWLLAGLCITAALSVFSFTVIVLHRSVFTSDSSGDDTAASASSFQAKSISFGSCAAYDMRDLDIWTDAILPAKPEAWIWVGDMVYLDDGEMNCAVYEGSPEWQATCNCSASWIEQPPYSCHAGDVEYAANRWLASLRNQPYNEFLDYMCPRSLSLGYFPPPGHSPQICDKPIWGIYDDHDFGWNNGNRREPNKREFKNLYLDAIGEDRNSPRRNADRGAWTKYSLNADNPNQQVDVFLLDERYERETLPCDTRLDYCEKVVLSPSAQVGSSIKAWCQDFLHGGALQKGTCCRKDEEIFFGWCNRNTSIANPLFPYACDVTSELFGMKSLRLDDRTGELVEKVSSTDAIDWAQESPFCEVLGRTQRKWLRKVVQESTAPLQVFVSGSVLVYNPTQSVCGEYVQDSKPPEEVMCRCGGDNMDCFRVAQLELLHTISTSHGCAVVLTGDYHFADIKALRGGDRVYASYYNSSHLSKPIVQVMASGMSASTARNFSCEDFRLDPMGLRTHPECSFVTGPNYGRLLMETEGDHLARVRMQILSGLQPNLVLLETVIDAKTCQILPSSS